MGAGTSKKEEEEESRMYNVNAQRNMVGQFNNRGGMHRGGAKKTKRRSTRKLSKSARKSYRRHRKKSQCVGKSQAFCARTRARYRASGGVTKGCKWASGPKISFCRSAGNRSRAKSKKSSK